MKQIIYFLTKLYHHTTRQTAQPVQPTTSMKLPTLGMNEWLRLSTDTFSLNCFTLLEQRNTKTLDISVTTTCYKIKRLFY